MHPLENIPGLGPDVASLLEAAGVRRVRQLMREDPVKLRRRLELIAWQRGLKTPVPDAESVAAWVAAAAPLGETEPETDDSASLPEAIVEPTAGAGWVPPALRAAKEVTAGADVREKRSAAPLPEGWRQVDPQRFATIEDYNEGRLAIQGALAGDRREERLEVPAGKRELPRWVRRGVVHPRPWHTWLGALVSVAFRLGMVGSVGWLIWLLTQVERPGDYKTPVMIGAAVLTVLGLLQLHYAMRARCRICSCPLYYSKNCLKNRKAHHLPGLGHVMSLALHLLIFGWFRCMYCGTAIRLRDDRQGRGD